VTELDRRSFLRSAGGSGLTLVASCDLATPAARLMKSVCRPGPPIPRKLQQALRGHVFARGSPGFTGAAQVYNELFDNVRPRWIARPVDTADVRAAVRWAVANHVNLRARSGGHSYAGYSTLSNGLVLDMRNMRSVTVNRRAGVATIGAGAQLIDVYAALAAHAATIPAGSCPSVGLAGHALGGGMGLAGRAFGLTTDHVVAAQIVTADGCVRTASRRSEPELFWALRGGGGGNFGVVTHLQLRVHPLPRSAAWFVVRWPWSSANDAIEAWQAWAPHAPDQVSSVFHLQTSPSGPEVLVAGQYLGSSGSLGGLLRQLRAVPGASVSSGQEGYLALQLRWAGCAHQSQRSCHTTGTRPGGTLGRERFRARSDYVNRPLTASARATLVGAIESRQGQPGSAAILFDSYGGAINRVAPRATAFVHRNSLFAIQYLTYDGGSAWLAQTWAAMRPYVSGMAYQNYIDPELKNWRRAYYGSNYGRLLAVRRSVDPEHHFNFPQAIGR
jgi:FAD/FMN-containing dehydrogenase